MDNQITISLSVTTNPNPTTPQISPNLPIKGIFLGISLHPPPELPHPKSILITNSSHGTPTRKEPSFAKERPQEKKTQHHQPPHCKRNNKKQVRSCPYKILIATLSLYVCRRGVERERAEEKKATQIKGKSY